MSTDDTPNIYIPYVQGWYSQNLNIFYIMSTANAPNI